MGCGCSGKTNVYRPPGEPAQAGAKPEPARGLPKVWNGPKPKPAVKP